MCVCCVYACALMDVCSHILRFSTSAYTHADVDVEVDVHVHFLCSCAPLGRVGVGSFDRRSFDV